MTIFFLAFGLKIRHEIHEGARATRAKLGVQVPSGLAGLVALCTGPFLLRERAR
jgi:hypothetical protein